MKEKLAKLMMKIIQLKNSDNLKLNITMLVTF